MGLQRCAMESAWTGVPVWQYFLRSGRAAARLAGKSAFLFAVLQDSMADPGRRRHPVIAAFHGTMIVSIASMFIFRIGFSYVIGVQMGYGAIGVWISAIVGM